MLDRVVDVAVGILLQHLPKAAVLVKGVGAFFFSFFKQKWNDAVLANVIGDVFLCVIGAHGRAIVDVFFENIAHNIRVNIFSAGGFARVQMPVELIEKVERALNDA